MFQVRIMCKVLFDLTTDVLFAVSSCIDYCSSINTWCEMFTDDLPDFDTVPDIRTLHAMRGTTLTKGLGSNDSEFDGKRTFVLTYFLLCTCAVI